MSTARATTPTGIPIEDCGECGRRHPVTRSHCSACGSAAFFCHPGADRTPSLSPLSENAGRNDR